MSILWRHKWKTFFAATIGIGAGIYYNRDYVIEKVSQGVQNYIKNPRPFLFIFDHIPPHFMPSQAIGYLAWE